MGKKNLITTKYQIRGPKKLTIALITDLHEKRADHVLGKLKEISPDMILIAGDTFERHDRGEGPDDGDRSLLSMLVAFFILTVDSVFKAVSNLAYSVKARFGTVECKDTCSENSYRFLKAAAKIAPVYMSLGNHERYLTEEDIAVIKETGIVLLDNEYTSVSLDREKDRENQKGDTGNSARNMGKLWIGGLSSHVDVDMLERFSREEGYKILLCHHPEYYEPYMSGKNIDLVCSGHAHGGQIRVFGHGLFAPGQGFLPKYHHGLYDMNNAGAYMLVSSGCANTTSVPRWGNPCEVVKINIDL